ncbi:MAG: hypothetical protein ACOVS5_04870, partial [Oligoflexus sp.]
MKVCSWQNWIYSCAVALALVSGCKCQRTESQARAYPARNGPVIYATDLAELEDIRDFYKRVFGVDGYTTKWSELDKFRTGSGITARRPYLDSWYPEASGGTNAASALTKYDRAFNNGENRAANWEAQQHSRSSPAWYGHCNGTSVAGIRYQNPRNQVNRPRACTSGSAGCTTFTPADIRALLSEMNMNARAKFISGNRCRLTQTEIEARPIVRSNPRVMDDCDDVNPGSFHVSLLNFLGRMKQPIIFDENKDEEVWNYPIYSYSYTPEGPLSEAQAVSASGLPIQSWIFNPDARSFYKISMTINFRMSRSDFEGAGTNPEAMNSISYEYILELNAAGEIIGGEWINASRNNHPDFIWMPFEPQEPTGDASRGNPFISNLEVTRLWAESVGLNPEYPFRDKPNNPYDVRFFPPLDLSWGDVAGFYRVLLDGRSTGSVFLGKKTHMRIDVEEALRGNSTVEVQLNGQALSSGSPVEGRLDILFDAAPGINFLSLRWTSDRVDASEVNWDFRFYAMVMQPYLYIN